MMFLVGSTHILNSDTSDDPFPFEAESCKHVR